MRRFEQSFTQQEPIGEESIERAIEVMRSGRLHRYNVAGDEESETSLLEREFADLLGTEYCLACASGGYAIHVALRSARVRTGDPVLTNAFTLSPVPGAIHNAGGRPVLVEVTRDLTIDLEDLERKIGSSGARLLLLSHMRGHIVDMDALADLLDANGVTLIEDCAHTMGGSWNGRASGTFGLAACFSTQTYKHINSGEGGFITSDDAEFMARAIVYSGSYMLYERHGAAPAAGVFEDIRLDTPNYSGRMDNLRAAILRPQLATLEQSCRRWNERYAIIERSLRKTKGISVPRRPSEEGYVGSSIQFLIQQRPDEDMRRFVSACRDRGIEIKWFGDPDPSGYTSRHQSWRYVEEQSLPASDAVLQGLCDMRIPLTFSVDDCVIVADLIAEAFEATFGDSSKNDVAVIGHAQASGKHGMMSGAHESSRQKEPCR